MSTLRELHPLIRPDLERSISFHSQRSGGSFKQILRRPTRLFETLRKYIPGDPVKFIDWKIFARTDQVLLRERQEESTINTAIVVDINDSMRWPSRDDLLEIKGSHPTKLAVAWRIAMSIAYSHLGSGDVVAIYTTEKGVLQPRKSPRSGTEVLQSFAKFLANEEGFSLDATGAPPKKVEKLWLITDGMHDTQLLPEAKKQKCMIHLLSHLEADPDWMQEDVSYFDFAKGLKEYKGDFLKAQYGDKFSNWSKSFESKSQASGFEYLRFTDLTPIEQFMMQVGIDGKS